MKKFKYIGENNIEEFDDGTQYMFTLKCMSNDFKQKGIEIDKDEYSDTCWIGVVLVGKDGYIMQRDLWYIENNGDIHEFGILDDDVFSELISKCNTGNYKIKKDV